MLLNFLIDKRLKARDYKGTYHFYDSENKVFSVMIADRLIKILKNKKKHVLLSLTEQPKITGIYLNNTTSNNDRNTYINSHINFDSNIIINTNNSFVFPDWTYHVINIVFTSLDHFTSLSSLKLLSV